MDRLTLNDALAEGRLEEFIVQAEAAGVGAVDGDEFEARLTSLIKAPPQVRRTSRSRGHDDSAGK